MEGEHQVSQFKYFCIDFVVGTATSFVQLFCSYPFDLLKTRMQLSNQFNALQTMKNIFKNEGFLVYYRGISSPLFGAMLGGSVFFSTYEAARRQFAIFYGRMNSDYLPMQQIFLSGSFAGVVTSLMCAPLEFCKIQTQKENPSKKKGPLSLLLQEYRRGGIRKIYKGFGIQITRDFIGCGCFFMAYEYSLFSFTPPGGQRKDVSNVGVLVAGISAGIAYWSFMYPIDMVKTRIQSDDIANPRYTGEGGLGCFYRGYLLTNLLSILRNVTGLFAYENLHRIGYSTLIE